MEIKKLNLSNEDETRERVLRGITDMNNLVSKTLGPAGRSVLIERGVGEPLIVDDGRRVAENIKLEDPIGQLAVRVCYGVTRKTDEKVGDGTTTSMVLTHAILEWISRNRITFGGMVGARTSVNEVEAELIDSKNKVIKELEKMAKPVKTEKELIEVATVSAGDPELGKTIGQMYFKLGQEGHISMEFNLLDEKITSEIVPGYRFSGGYAANWMITDGLKKVAVVDDAPVLVVNNKHLDSDMITPLMKEMANSGKDRVVIIAPRFQPSLLRDVYKTYIKSNFAILCVRAPSRGEEAFRDIAVFTGAKYFGPDDEFNLASKSDLGHVDKIEVSDDTTFLIGGAGKESELKKRVKEVLAEAELQKMPQFKKERFERASALSGGVGVIRIGAPTDEERNWLKYKIEDAVQATKHAFRTGVLPGGGQAYIKVSDMLPEGDVLKDVLKAPYEKLKENAGGKFVIGKNVFDPLAVEKAALENAVSAVSKLMRIGGAIAYLPKPKLEEAFTSVFGQGGEEDDHGIQEDTE